METSAECACQVVGYVGRLILRPRETHFGGKNNPDLSVHYGKKRCDGLAIVFIRIRGNMSCERDYGRMFDQDGKQRFSPDKRGIGRIYAG